MVTKASSCSQPTLKRYLSILWMIVFYSMIRHLIINGWGPKGHLFHQLFCKNLKKHSDPMNSFKLLRYKIEISTIQYTFWVVSTCMYTYFTWILYKIRTYKRTVLKIMTNAYIVHTVITSLVQLNIQHFRCFRVFLWSQDRPYIYIQKHDYDYNMFLFFPHLSPIPMFT